MTMQAKTIWRIIKHSCDLHSCEIWWLYCHSSEQLISRMKLAKLKAQSCPEDMHWQNNLRVAAAGITSHTHILMKLKSHIT
jgi:hypothetical protein